MAIDTLYADRIVNLTVVNGMVRIELGIVENYTEGKERKQRAEVTQRIVMPFEGFVASFGAQQRMLRALRARAKQAADAKAGAAAPAPKSAG